MLESLLKTITKSHRRPARLVSIILLIGCLTTACQSSPENKIIQDQKGKMFEIIDANNGNKTQFFPSTYESAIISKNKALEVMIRANISAEKAANYPVYTLKPMDISNEFAARIMHALFGNKELYAHPVYGGDFTVGKDWLGYAITGLKAKQGTGDSKRANDDLKQELERYQAMYANAPETMYTVPALKTFSPILEMEALLELEQEWKDGRFNNEAEYQRQKQALEEAISNGSDNMTIKGMIDLGNGRQGDLIINKTKDKKNNFVFYQVGRLEDAVAESTGIYSVNISDSFKDLKMSEAEAISMANQIISDMGIHGMSLGKMSTGVAKTGSEYWLSYFRDMNGTMSKGTFGTNSGLIEYRASWSQEIIKIRINNEGVCYFEWESPTEVVETITNQISLLDFNEIMNIFEQQILINQAFASEDNEYATQRQLVIEKITLSTMTVPQPNNQNEYIAIPVWDFEGYQVITYSDDYQNHVKENGGYQLDEHNQRIVKVDGQSFLTINAIDGSIIDRALGY